MSLPFPSLPPSLTPSLPLFLPHSLSPSLPPSLPPFLPPIYFLPPISFHSVAESSTDSLEDHHYTFSETQLQQLQKAYHSGQHNDTAFVQELANRIKLPEPKIKVHTYTR